MAHDYMFKYPEPNDTKNYFAKTPEERPGLGFLLAEMAAIHHNIDYRSYFGSGDDHFDFVSVLKDRRNIDHFVRYLENTYASLLKDTESIEKAGIPGDYAETLAALAKDQSWVAYEDAEKILEVLERIPALVNYSHTKLRPALEAQKKKGPTEISGGLCDGIFRQ